MNSEPGSIEINLKEGGGFNFIGLSDDQLWFIRGEIRDYLATGKWNEPSITKADLLEANEVANTLFGVFDYEEQSFDARLKAISLVAKWLKEWRRQ